LKAQLAFAPGIWSIKDRPALYILKAAVEEGKITSDTTVIESSSGNFAIALATICRLLRLRFVPVVDPSIPALYEAMLTSLCDRVVKVVDRDSTGGYLQTRLARVGQIVAETPNCFWTDQYHNERGVEAHAMITGRQITDAFSRLEYVFLAVSTGATLAGVSRVVKTAYPGVKIIAVDVEGSSAFGLPGKKRSISGIGSSIEAALAKKAVIDDVVIVSEQDTILGCRELLEYHGLFLGGSSGSAYAAVKKYANEIRGDRLAHALFLCADRGIGYVDTIYNDAWCDSVIKH